MIISVTNEPTRFQSTRFHMEPSTSQIKDISLNDSNYHSSRLPKSLNNSFVMIIDVEAIDPRNGSINLVEIGIIVLNASVPSLHEVGHFFCKMKPRRNKKNQIVENDSTIEYYKNSNQLEELTDIRTNPKRLDQSVGFDYMINFFTHFKQSNVRLFSDNPVLDIAGLNEFGLQNDPKFDQIEKLFNDRFRPAINHRLVSQLVGPWGSPKGREIGRIIKRHRNSSSIHNSLGDARCSAKTMRIWDKNSFDSIYQLKR